MEWHTILEAIKALGPTGVTVGAAFWAIFQIIKIGDKHFAEQTQNTMKIIQNHEVERSTWINTLVKLNDMIDRSSGYQRQEHAQMIEILRVLQNDVNHIKG